ncbi:hypothetical protein [Streptomyces sp. SAJ15]|uniref:hypothetical protein n=1 Tax=Streptomyces sp. SAJ15 TaxID=2011095 RepID=UPI0011853F53|nr:hypothetical protein [Streptomyces sp. SAJ15]
MIETETRPASALKVAGIGCAVVVLAPVLLLLGLVVVYQIERATPEDYPDVKPDTMARRISGYSLDAYAALGLNRTLNPGGYEAKTNNENSFGSDRCYPDGLEGMADEPEEGTPPLDGGQGRKVRGPCGAAQSPGAP